MLRCAAAGVRAAAGGPSAAGMVVRPFSVMDKLRGMLGMSGAMDAGSAITDFQKLDPKAIKDEVQKMTLEAFVSTKRSALSGIKGKVLGMAVRGVC